MRWSPETVLTATSDRPSSASKSPETSVAEIGPVDRPEAHVAGDGLDARLSVDGGSAHVAARGLDAQSGDVVDGHVPRGGLRLRPRRAGRRS